MTIKKISRSAVFQAGIKVLTAAFMTFILMYISSNVYQKSPFIEVEFQTKQNNELTYQVYYTTDSKKPFGFNEKQSVKKRVSAGLHTEHLILPIKNIVQFRLDVGSYPGEVNILKIVLKGKNEQVLNLKDFRFVNVESHDFQNNQLTIVSNHIDPFIIHQKPLKIEPAHTIDWCFFLGLLCIYGFVSYALISYLSTLKVLRNHSLIDIIFVCLFFGSLFIPMMNISNEEKSDLENRTLATKPVVSEIFKEKSEYGKAFENWFNDHFFGRNQMMFVHDEIRNKVNKVLRANDLLYFKENSWIFYSGEYMDSKLIQPIMQNIKKFNEFCKENNIKLYLLMVPRKDFVYQEFLYDYGFDKKQYNRLNEIYATVKNEAQKINVPFVYPLNEMQEAKQKDYVFFKLTNHWTDWGAYIAYQALMKEIQKDFQDIPVVTLNEYDKSQNKLIRDDWGRSYHKGHLDRFFHLKNDEEKDVNYIYYTHKNKNLLQTKIGQYTKDFSYPSGKYRILLMGDSQNENLTQFIPYSPHELKYIRVNKRKLPRYTNLWKIMKLYKDEILSFKPDILVLSFTDVNLLRFQFLTSN